MNEADRIIKKVYGQSFSLANLPKEDAEEKKVSIRSLLNSGYGLELVYPNELFPTEVRAFAVGVGSSMSRIGSAAGTWLVPYSLATLGIGNTMYIAAAVSVAGLLASVWLAPETKGMMLEKAASLAR